MTYTIRNSKRVIAKMLLPAIAAFSSAAPSFAVTAVREIKTTAMSDIPMAEFQSSLPLVMETGVTPMPFTPADQSDLDVLQEVNANDILRPEREGIARNQFNLNDPKEMAPLVKRFKLMHGELAMLILANPHRREQLLRDAYLAAAGGIRGRQDEMIQAAKRISQKAEASLNAGATIDSIKETLVFLEKIADAAMSEQPMTDRYLGAGEAQMTAARVQHAQTLLISAVARMRSQDDAEKLRQLGLGRYIQPPLASHSFHTNNLQPSSNPNR